MTCNAMAYSSFVGVGKYIRQHWQVFLPVLPAKNPGFSLHCLALDVWSITLINPDAPWDICLLDEIVQRLMAYRFSALSSIVTRLELVII